MSVDYLRNTPCSSCASLRREGETGEYICAGSPYGDCDCPPATQAAEVEDLAACLATAITTLTDERLRRTMAWHASEGIAAVLTECNLPARLDERVFCRACDVAAATR